MAAIISLLCIGLNTGYGKIKIFTDDNCPAKLGFLLSMDTWFRDNTFGTYCNAPGHNVRIMF